MIQALYADNVLCTTHLMSSMVRAFIGLSIPFYLSTQLNAVATDIAMQDRGQMTWVSEDNYHVTLLFLGDQTMRWLEDFANELDTSLELHAPELKATEIIPFPQGSPKLLAALLEPNNALLRMHKQVKYAAARLGFVPEKKRFRPHVTLARKFPYSGQMTIPALGPEMSDHAMNLTIFESRLSTSGAEYYPIFEFDLT